MKLGYSHWATSSIFFYIFKILKKDFLKCLNCPHRAGSHSSPEGALEGSQEIGNMRVHGGSQASAFKSAGITDPSHHVHLLPLSTLILTASLPSRVCVAESVLVQKVPPLQPIRPVLLWGTLTCPPTACSPSPVPWEVGADPGLLAHQEEPVPICVKKPVEWALHSLDLTSSAPMYKPHSTQQRVLILGTFCMQIWPWIAFSSSDKGTNLSIHCHSISELTKFFQSHHPI